jgi:ferric-dicitrate binding protein FerR (iron transport regulator)
VIAGIVGSLAAAAAVGLVIKSKMSSDGPSTAVVEAPWSGKVASVSRASADKTGGLEACDAAGACEVIPAGAEVRPGTKLRTDARTRAYLTLEDGTSLALDRGTHLELNAKKNRAARLEQGTVVADIAPSTGAEPARFWTPQGDVEVLGTKLSITAGEERASVEVARGSVRVRGRSGKDVEVRAGEEATLSRDGDAVVASSTSLADVMEWSDRSPEEVDTPVLRGLGELRARKPGQTKERDRAVRLAKHAVKVRIVDVVARTEVDETFANDTDEELEGIFRFPLPPGAQIERLALEVDGKLIEGAFVDRDRGAAIWRGVIQNAAPKAPKPREEIIWVAGPWRDPALLEWQRGGRFELRIFPIPKRGSRRVILTYTQLVDQAAGVRRFTYPLAHDSSGTTKVDSFDMDLQVLGHDKAFGVQTRGYELASASSPDGSAERRTMSASSFTPAGDLTVEYALPDREREVTAWAYKMDSAPPAPADAQAAPAATAASKAKTAEEKAAIEAAAAITGDTSPYVAIAVRPRLPRWQEAKERTHVIVVDSSRSMIGERFARATRLASSIVREMDRRDTFVMLACDTVCRAMPSQDGGIGKPMAPGAAASGEVDRFLGGIEPDGGSDLAASVLAARAAAGSIGGKELRILYLGDGTPTVGPTRGSHIETAVRSAMPSGDAAVVAVALGADADVASLQSLARGGGGVVVPYVPGQKVSSAALDVLGAAYGVVLRDPEVELPAGLTQVTPARLDPIRAGGETFIVARMSGGSESVGSIKLKGRVAGERFEQTYPVKILATSSAGNAFVPRLYAAAKIAEIERVGGETQKPTVVELSKRFAVASKFTSLLVLESEAMFKAFGLDRGSVAPTFTGELQAESSSADADGEPEPDDVAAVGDGFGSGHGRLGGKSRSAADEAGPMADKGNSQPAGGAGAPAPMATMAPPMTPPMEAPGFNVPQTTSPSPAKKSSRPIDSSFDDSSRADRRRMVPMKRIFERQGGFEAVNTLARQNATKLVVAESAFATTPDSRDKTVELYALYATSGRVGDAQELTAKWSSRDALDPDALTARADLAARQGDRERAVRILGGLADVRPGDRATQTRLADLHESAGNSALACEHRIALASLAMSDAKLVADAIRCTRAQGMVDLASQIRLDANDKVRESIDKLLAASSAPPAATPLRGDVQITADWTGAVDLDIALIDAQGRRISWMGSPIKAAVSSRDATSSRSETLALTNLPSGSYVVEISRASGVDANAFAQGTVTLRLVNETRRIPFTLSGPRAEIGTARIFFTSRLVPATSFGGGWR